VPEKKRVVGYDDCQTSSFLRSKSKVGIRPAINHFSTLPPVSDILYSHHSLSGIMMVSHPPIFV